MGTIHPDDSSPARTHCDRCFKEIAVEHLYHHQGKAFCEDCLLDLTMPRNRKTHWQYLKSIKNEYLRPGKKA